jgi:hypothetical protein
MHRPISSLIISLSYFIVLIFLKKGNDLCLLP